MTKEEIENKCQKKVNELIFHISKIAENGKDDLQKYIDNAESRFLKSTEEHDTKLANMMLEISLATYIGGLKEGLI